MIKRERATGREQDFKSREGERARERARGTERENERVSKRYRE